MTTVKSWCKVSIENNKNLKFLILHGCSCYMEGTVCVLYNVWLNQETWDESYKNN